MALKFPPLQGRGGGGGAKHPKGVDDKFPAGSSDERNEGERWFRCQQCKQKMPEKEFKKHQREKGSPCEVVRCAACDMMFLRADKKQHCEICPQLHKLLNAPRPPDSDEELVTRSPATPPPCMRPPPSLPAQASAPAPSNSLPPHSVVLAPLPKPSTPTTPSGLPSLSPLAPSPPTFAPPRSTAGHAQQDATQAAGSNAVEERDGVDLMATVNAQKIYVGDRVAVPPGGRTGEVMYVGPAAFSGGDIVVGVRLDEKRTTSDCDGKYKGERFFRCQPGYGIYVFMEDVTVLGRSNGSAESSSPATDDLLDLEKELEPLIGLCKAKAFLRSVRNAVEVNRRRQAFGVKVDIPRHLVFQGNAGVGKRTIARIFGRLLKHLKLLGKGALIKATRKDLVDCNGDAGAATSSIIKKSLGSVLYVEDSPALKSEDGQDPRGAQAVAALLKEIGDSKEQLVVVLGGAAAGLGSLLSAFPQLQGVFAVTVDFPDLTPEEMVELLVQEVKSKGFQLREDVTPINLVDVVRRAQKGADQHNSNSVLVQRVVTKAIAQQTDRVFTDGTLSQASLTTLIEEDFVDRELEPARSTEQVLALLDKIVGLAAVKKFVRSLQAQLMINCDRKAAGIPITDNGALHMIFTGNPGTGKTTIARVIADLLRALGLLRKGHLVEADRSCLVAGYAGQTAIKTRSVVQSALGGVLFVDEAYTLAGNDKDQFGNEALDTLMKLMEDHREDLVVIFAGYKEEMKALVSRNPGVRSRFPTTIEFEDYTPAELMQIADGMLEKEHMNLTPETREVLQQRFEGMERLPEDRKREGGNGRAVRNMIEQAKRSHALRLAGMEPGKRTPMDLQTLTAADFTAQVEAGP